MEKNLNEQEKQFQEFYKREIKSRVSQTLYIQKRDL